MYLSYCEYTKQKVKKKNIGLVYMADVKGTLKRGNQVC